jgi:hypothetical protein
VSMTQEEQQRLFDLVANPPPGSKIAAAKEFGIDLTLNLRSLAFSPEERVREMEGALEFVEELQRAAAKLRQ